MEWLESVKRKIQTTNRLIAAIGAFFLLPLMLMTAGDVLSRDLFNHPLPGTIELSEYMLSVFILLGIAYTHQVKAHVEVSILTSRLSPEIQFILRVITGLVSLFIFSILVWQGWVVGVRERTVSDLLRIPQYPFRLLITVAAFFCCLEFLIDIGDSIKKLSRGSL